MTLGKGDARGEGGSEEPPSLPAPVVAPTVTPDGTLVQYRWITLTTFAEAARQEVECGDLDVDWSMWIWRSYGRIASSVIIIEAERKLRNGGADDEMPAALLLPPSSGKLEQLERRKELECRAWLLKYAEHYAYLTSPAKELRESWLSELRLNAVFRRSAARDMLSVLELVNRVETMSFASIKAFHDAQPGEKSMSEKYDYEFMKRANVPKYPFLTALPDIHSEAEFKTFLMTMVKRDDRKGANGQPLFSLAPADAVWLAYSVGFHLTTGKHGAAATILDKALNEEVGTVVRKARKITPSHVFIAMSNNAKPDDISLVGRPKKKRRILQGTRPYMAKGQQGLSQAVYLGVRFKAPHEMQLDSEFMLKQLESVRHYHRLATDNFWNATRFKTKTIL